MAGLRVNGTDPPYHFKCIDMLWRKKTACEAALDSSPTSTLRVGDYGLKYLVLNLLKPTPFAEGPICHGLSHHTGLLTISYQNEGDHLNKLNNYNKSRQAKAMKSRSRHG